jgi:homoserine dehydrogenase
MATTTIQIALLGFGTVGSAVYKNLQQNQNVISKKTGLRLNVKTVLARSPEKIKSQLKPECKISTSFEEILNDPEVAIIVEVMGGTDFAKNCIYEALKKGKHVVTANKALIAVHAKELAEAVRTSKGSFFYEAAVAGGIPIIAALQNSFAGNKIQSIQSIVNGTCNYILTQMADKQIDFPVALKTAIDKGYAETDPSFDIEGVDAAHKLTILACLSYGQLIEYRSLDNVRGISKVSIQDIQVARNLGYAVKLIASASKVTGGLELFVAPCLVNQHHPLASVGGVYNAIYLEANPVGQSMLYGRGAGGDPTSSAILSDLIACARECILGNLKHNLFFEKKETDIPILPHGAPSSFYIRLWAEDKPGVLAKIAGILGNKNISIASVLQKNVESSQTVPVFLTTHQAKENDMREACKEIHTQVPLKDEPFIMRILN